MKKFAAALLVLLLTTAPAWGKTINVRFPKGRTTVILKGRTTGGPSESGGMNPISYRLRARAGQTLISYVPVLGSGPLQSVKFEPTSIGFMPGAQTPKMAFFFAEVR
jgi:hypothetical protein